jgi:hypothetical protein
MFKRGERMTVKRMRGRLNETRLEILKVSGLTAYCVAFPSNYSIIY